MEYSRVRPRHRLNLQRRKSGREARDGGIGKGDRVCVIAGDEDDDAEGAFGDEGELGVVAGEVAAWKGVSLGEGWIRGIG